MSDVSTTMLQYFVVVGGSILVVMGALTLLATWFAPRMLERRLFQPRMLGRFARTRTNLTVVACWELAWGSFLLMFGLDAYPTLRLWIGAASVVLMIPAVRLLRHKPSAAASKQ